MKKRAAAFILLTSISLWVFGGCTRFALRLSPSLIPGLTESFFEECDIELAENSIPASLKILEGLLKRDPENKAILRALSMGFCGYSLLFVEDMEPERSSDLYLRSRDYGIKALGFKIDTFVNLDSDGLMSLLRNMGRRDLETLLWVTVSWNAWINLNLDRPAALAQFGLSQKCLSQLLRKIPRYQHGLVYILMGTSLSALPPMLGGDPQRAMDSFNKAMEISKGKYFLAQYYFAKYYAVRVQDKNLFSELIADIIRRDPRELSDSCLINSIIQKKARRLQEKENDLFF